MGQEFTSIARLFGWVSKASALTVLIESFNWVFFIVAKRFQRSHQKWTRKSCICFIQLYFNSVIIIVLYKAHQSWIAKTQNVHLFSITTVLFLWYVVDMNIFDVPDVTHFYHIITTSRGSLRMVFPTWDMWMEDIHHGLYYILLLQNLE